MPIMATLVMSFLWAHGQNHDLKLWYNKPAGIWTEALPLGNGRIGAMVFGGVSHELIQLNEATLWSGGPVRGDVNPGAPAYLPRVRQALFRETTTWPKSWTNTCRACTRKASSRWAT